MRKIGKLIILIIPLCIILVACEHTLGNPDAKRNLPPITNTGENTFGMKVNGEVWIMSRSKSIIFPPQPLYFYRSCRDSCLELGVYDDEKYIQNIKNISMTFDTRNDNITPVEISATLRNPETKETFSQSVKISGSAAADSFSNLDLNVINTDTILSGQFNFTFTHPEFEKEFIITEGRFDVKL